MSNPGGPDLFSQQDSKPERRIYSVARLNNDVRMLLERGMPVVWVQGELSNLSQPSSGHWYFSLKDRDAQIRCAMFRQRNTQIGFIPKAGAAVLARGRVSLYEPRGDFQLIVDHLEEAGVGRLQREYERLKQRLAAEGLFATERKRRLPAFPRRIAVVTSPTGAAIRDVLNILRRRYPAASVLIYPTPVQGGAAAPGIVAALRTASDQRLCDVVILTRGGGSIEDLWAFNDERVARAIHACSLPVVAGIGHEIDFTIADFVADARAPTPSGAAELVAPDSDRCLDTLTRLRARLASALRREMRMISMRFDALSRRLGMAHPGARLAQLMQRADDLEQRLERAARETIGRAEHRAALAARALNAVSPLAILSRGFSIVLADGSGFAGGGVPSLATGGTTAGAGTRATVVTDASTLERGDAITAVLARGRVHATVISTSPDTSEPLRKDSKP